MRASWQHILRDAVFLWGSTICLGGCADDVVSEDGGEGLVGKVQVDMAMAVTTSPSVMVQSSRMTGATTQQDGNYRGIRQLKLYAMKKMEGSSALSQDVGAIREFTPLTINGTHVDTDIDFQPKGNQPEMAAFANEISLPIGTNHMIGYGSVGRAFGAPDPSDSKTFFDTGVLLSAWTLEPNFDEMANHLSDFYFGPRSIFMGSLNDAKLEDACRLLRLVNRPLQVKVGQDTWKSAAASNLNVVLKNTYEEYTKNKAGAFKNVKSLLESLYINLGEIGSGKPGYDLAQAIRERILNPAPPITVNQGMSHEITYVDDIQFTADQNSGALTLVTQGKPPTLATYDFPHELSLPDGAAVLVFKSGDEGDQWTQENDAFQYFRFNEDETTSTGGLPVMSFAYPAELLYRVESPLKSSNGTHQGEWVTTATWQDFLAKYDGNKLIATSKSIVLEQPLHYMVACLETKAFLASNSLPDASTPSTKENVTIPPEGFPIIGIIVGMQRFVGWDGRVRQTPESQLDLQYAYYDHHLNGESLRVSASSKDFPLSYTLVLESAPSTLSQLQNAGSGVSEGKRTKQIVMLELENNTGVDFHGLENQLIAKGAHFYLMGELNLHNEYLKDANLAEEQKKFTDSNKDYRVFEQGKTTKVTLKISSLAGAYNSIPDLRNPSLKMSLQTVWNWHNGVIFEDNIPLPLP